MQARWSGQASAIGSFQDYAASVGLDEGDFEACLQSDRYADVVTANMELGAQLGVTGTPTVMVNADGQVRRVAAGFDAILEAVNDLSPAAGGN